MAFAVRCLIWWLVVLLVFVTGARAEEEVMLVPQLGHDEAVETVQLSRDGRLLLTSSADRTAILWDVATGRVLRRFGGAPSPLLTAAFSPDGSRIITSGRYGNRLFDVSTGELLQLLPNQAAGSSWGSFSDDGAFAVTCEPAGGLTCLWTMEVPGVPPSCFASRATLPYMARLSPDNAFLVGWVDGAAAGLWDTHTQEEIDTFQRGAAHVDMFWGSGNALIRVEQRRISVVEVPSMKVRHTWATSHRVLQAALSSDRRQLATATSVGAALWSIESGQLVRPLSDFPTEGLLVSGRVARSRAMAFTHDGTRVVVGGRRGGIWDVDSGARIATLADQAEPITHLDVTGDDRLVVGASPDGVARLWDLRTGALLRAFEGSASPVEGATFDVEGRIVTASRDGEVVVWDPIVGRPVRRASFDSPVLSSGGSTLVARTSDAQVSVWDIPTQTERHRLPIPIGSSDVAVSSDGSRLLVCSVEGLDVLWDIAEGQVLHRSESIGGRCRLLEGAESSAFDRQDGSALLAVSRDGAWGFGVLGGAYAFWDVHNQRVTRTFEADVGWYDLALSDDGRHFVLAPNDGFEIRLMDVRSAEVAHVLDLGAVPTVIRFSPDGKHLVTGTEHGQVVLWDVESGERIRTIREAGAFVSSAMFSSDGVRLLFSSRDGTTTLVDGRTGEVRATLVSLDDDTWIVADAAGRFDTEDAGEVGGAAWTRRFDPLRPLEITTFRSSFTPGLLRDLWMGASLAPADDLTNVNVLTPTITLESEPRGGRHHVEVRVEPQRAILPTKQGPQWVSSGAYDLHLLQDRRLVAHVVGDLEDAVTVHRFVVPLPSGTPFVELEAYAYNGEEVKSSSAVFTIDNPRADVLPEPRAFLINIGVNETRAGGLGALSWAAADAAALREALGRVPDHVVSPVLLADGGDAPPTRSNLQKVLEVLAGRADPPSWAPDLTVSTPDDLVIVTFAGHGLTEEGVFRLALADGFVSEFELAEDLRAVLAREIALVIDACQSAASVEGEGFKPGPLASRGFGQLAYDKGMLVLAASQSDGVAHEDPERKHGLLTWALVREGLDGRRADTNGEPGIQLREWFEFAEREVPKLGDALASASRSGRLDQEPVQITQRPRMFAFKDAGRTTLRQ